MLKGKFSSRRHVTEEVDAMAGVANLADVMLVFACGLMAAVILNWNVDLSKTRVEILQREQMQELDNAEEMEQDIQSSSSFEQKGTVYEDAQKFESAFYANPDLRSVKAPDEPQTALDVQSIIVQLQQSPELLSALTSLISNQGCK